MNRDPIKRRYAILRTSGLSGIVNESVGGPSVRALELPEIKVNLDIDELSSFDARRVSQDENVELLVPLMPMRLIKPVSRSAVDSSNETSTWGISHIDAAHSELNGSGIKVAVLDTGIDESHETFKGVNLITKDFTTEGIHDHNGHGTHCAGTIFGQDIDGTRIGIARNVESGIIAKVLGQGAGSTASIVSAILWAERQGAQIISMSLGIDFPGYVKELVQEYGYEEDRATSIALDDYRGTLNFFESAVDLLSAKRKKMNPCLLVAASGNESERPNYDISCAPPAVSSGILSVGAIDKNNKIADFSNTNPDICAPGVDIISASTGGGLLSLSGTSMATPHVAGAAALIAQKLMREGRLNLDNLRGQLLANASSTIFSNDFNTKDFGSGLVQVPLV